MAGRKPGGPKTGGRQKGTANRVGADVRALAREYTEQAIETLAKAMTKAEEWSARVAAAKILLERGWGAPKQDISVQQAVYVIGDRPLTPDEWAAKYAEPDPPPRVESPRRPAKRTGRMRPA